MNIKEEEEFRRIQPPGVATKHNGIKYNGKFRLNRKII